MVSVLHRCPLSQSSCLPATIFERRRGDHRFSAIRTHHRHITRIAAGHLTSGVGGTAVTHGGQAGQDGVRRDGGMGWNGMEWDGIGRTGKGGME